MSNAAQKIAEARDAAERRKQQPEPSSGEFSLTVHSAGKDIILEMSGVIRTQEEAERLSAILEVLREFLPDEECEVTPLKAVK